MKLWRLFFAIGIGVASLSSPAVAQNIIEQLVSPGPLTEDHAEFESQCESCHASFNRGAQQDLCLSCHEEIAADLAAQIGYHGRFPGADAACVTCHTEHEGREADIVGIDIAAFDHQFTDYPLRGGHTEVECESCHIEPAQFGAAPSDCVSCHEDSDPHMGRLGAECETCHNENDWTEIDFDHETTEFPLSGAHVETGCETCHAEETYADTPMACIACHREDDTHRGSLGEDCASCHTASDWAELKFDHDQTRFSLIGAHAREECEACHADEEYSGAETACIACHEEANPHEERLGLDCESCHTAFDWTVQRFDHDTTEFSLEGKHVETECAACHVEPSATVRIDPDCVSCHLEDDTHDGSLGSECASCHSAETWEVSDFDHAADTDFALLGGHAPLVCEACHSGPELDQAMSTSCLSCHLDDNVHETQLSENCVQCHDEESWDLAVRFDHGLGRFPLLGGHADEDCSSCHESQLYWDAPIACIDCHLEDDRHEGLLGPNCQACHDPSDWAHWIFDHDTQSDFPLTGAHVEVACLSCHRGGNPFVEQTSATCVSCHRADDSHQGNFGFDCERCHTSNSFDEIRQQF